MNRKLFKLKAAGLVVLGLFLMVGVLTLTFAFTNGKSNPTTVYFTGTLTTINGEPAWTLEGEDPGCDDGTKPCQVTYKGIGTPSSPVLLSDLENDDLFSIDSRKN